LDAALAKALAPRVAQILAEELGIEPGLANFEALADDYARCP
jgi:glycerol-3-phosphate dehydrogenase